MMLEPAIDGAHLRRQPEPERLEHAGGDRQGEGVVAHGPGEVLVHLALD
jgi:hypothetical protein